MGINHTIPADDNAGVEVSNAYSRYFEVLLRFPPDDNPAIARVIRHTYRDRAFRDANPYLHYRANVTEVNIDDVVGAREAVNQVLTTNYLTALELLPDAISDEGGHEGITAAAMGGGPIYEATGELNTHPLVRDAVTRVNVELKTKKRPSERVFEWTEGGVLYRLNVQAQKAKG